MTINIIANPTWIFNQADRQIRVFLKKFLAMDQLAQVIYDFGMSPPRLTPVITSHANPIKKVLNNHNQR